MRLTQFERKSIRDSVTKFFGTESKVFLFGSRAVDSALGGDIDLYVVPEHKSISDITHKIMLITDIQIKIGLQKIDVVLAKDETREIEKIAIKEGIELC